MQYLSKETSDLTEQEEQGIYLGKQPTFHPPCNLLSNTASTNMEELLPLLDFGLTTFGGEYTPTETLAGPTTTTFPSDREETSGPVNEVTVVQINNFIGARRSSGRVKKMREVDSLCECNTLITPEEKQDGTRVMECKGCRCETRWVCATICFVFHC
jgi:hypothetical protein